MTANQINPALDELDGHREVADSEVFARHGKTLAANLLK
jgi:tetrahydromethanopterin S-methyltransferase subunit G